MGDYPGIHNQYHVLLMCLHQLSPFAWMQKDYSLPLSLCRNQMHSRILSLSDTNGLINARLIFMAIDLPLTGIKMEWGTTLNPKGLQSQSRMAKDFALGATKIYTPGLRSSNSLMSCEITPVRK